MSNNNVLRQKLEEDKAMWSKALIDISMHLRIADENPDPRLDDRVYDLEPELQAYQSRLPEDKQNVFHDYVVGCRLEALEYTVRKFSDVLIL
jgi:hypothetical protein